ncbi:hypothetical protein [Aneurinibacillus thermoaerophilus]|uniref:hypothetical protein n=1 Tax=Aneurinibacillus thermoaerophilus TaxID=143495 RepID=UPI002E239B20|nr:hypothetical protein [Aneurinibacillus thermoaerophilus]MED0738805.1 hypothetical protein [Aneurinibacillus thermoaerophilus]MED0766298.1 hypothetical protein [Aneurinibacillus thermoaerophilus]
MKKIVKLGLATACILTVPSASLACAVKDSESSTTPAISTNSQDEGKEVDNKLLSVTLIDDAYHKGRDSFERTFTCSPSNGTLLNIHVKNKGSGKVRLKIYHNGYEKRNILIDPGTSTTEPFSNINGVGGNWKVYVTTDDGHEMDIFVRARQS